MFFNYYKKKPNLKRERLTDCDFNFLLDCNSPRLIQTSHANAVWPLETIIYSYMIYIINFLIEKSKIDAAFLIINE